MVDGKDITKKPTARVLLFLFPLAHPLAPSFQRL